MENLGQSFSTRESLITGLIVSREPTITFSSCPLIHLYDMLLVFTVLDSSLTCDCIECVLDTILLEDIGSLLSCRGDSGGEFEDTVESLGVTSSN